MRLHPLCGEVLVEPLRDWLGTWADAVGFHHERWDGTGYPRGMAGEEIPLAGRIVAIADVYDVITSTRSYKESASAIAGRDELVRCAGTQFDPRLVRAFVDMSLGRMRLVVGPISWLANVPLLDAPSAHAFAGCGTGRHRGARRAHGCRPRADPRRGTGSSGGPPAPSAPRGDRRAQRRP